MDEEVSGRDREQKKDMTIEDLCKLFVEESEITRRIIRGDHHTKNLMDSRNANQTSDDEEDDGEQGDDENDWLLRFDRLGKQLKTFQRDLISTDKKVENKKKSSSPLRKRRRKRR